ncbi:MAG: sodium:solute symporter family protein, partial [Rickettsia endosymbiont of Platyusa sonomae]|nr:sodium:solute symporter family protein [Rickettsia endosymbiont of Platyusa sonomae]
MHLSWDFDTAIFATFLIFNLAVGLFYSRGIKNIKEYAIGNRNFSTSTITATIIAT